MSSILIIDQYLPMPDRNSGGRRMFEIIKLMRADGHDVTFVARNKFLNDADYIQRLNEVGVQTLNVATPAVSAQDLRDCFHDKHIDVVIFSFYTTAVEYMSTCRELFPNAKIIVDAVDLHFVREMRQAEVTGNAQLMANAMQTRHYELNAYSTADALWAITPVERDILRREVAVNEIDLIPNIHDLGTAGLSYSQRHGLLFVGNFFHPPNAEGLGWFCQQVLPIVRSQIPDIQTTVVGAHAPEFFKQFASVGVHLADYVPDLTPLLAQARVSIAPLLHGAGMKGKVGEALAHGLPVVTTPIGAEGIGLTHGTDVLIADSAEAFASAIVLAYQNAEVWNMLAGNGRSFMARFTPEAVRNALRESLRIEPATQYVAVPDWNDEITVKRVVDSYIRKHQGSSESVLTLLLLDFDAEIAGHLITRWIAELGHNIETIPDVELTPISASQLATFSGDAIWVPMSRTIDKPAGLTQVETFCPIAVQA